jgi:hypothetical protein
MGNAIMECGKTDKCTALGNSIGRKEFYIEDSMRMTKGMARER